MNQILDILDQIRSVVTEQEATDGCFSGRDGGAVLPVAMDTAEDAGEAMLAYEGAVFQDESFGENYLRLYGFLQAIVLQQDAITELYARFHDRKFDARKLVGWSAIRKLRNRATGHPVKHNHVERIFITRISLKQWSFRYHVWNDKSEKNVVHEVNLKCLYEEYKQDAARVLGVVLEAARLKANRGGS